MKILVDDKLIDLTKIKVQIDFNKNDVSVFYQHLYLAMASKNTFSFTLTPDKEDQTNACND